MKKFDRGEIKRFLLAVDSKLEKPFTAIVIGGSAAALAFNASLTTGDIDTANDVSAIQGACRAAIEETGLKILVNFSAIADGPYAYQERLERLKLDRIKYLELWVPEKHDLALMKIIRGDEHDYEHVMEIHRNAKLELDVLTQRYVDEMTHVIGRPAALRLNFLSLIERLFGTKVAEGVERRLPAK